MVDIWWKIQNIRWDLARFCLEQIQEQLYLVTNVVIENDWIFNHIQNCIYINKRVFI